MKTILLATDFSNAANNATNYAIELAASHGSKLVLINAYSLPLTGMDSLPSFDILGKIADASIESLNETKAKAHKKHPQLQIECSSKIGSVISVLEQVALEYSDTIIVMGIVGDADALKEHVIGSTVMDVARNLKTTLFIIPEGVSFRKINKLSFAWALTGENDKDLASKAIYFSKLFGAELEIVNIENTEDSLHLPKVGKMEFIEEHFKNLKHSTLILDNKNEILALENYFKWYSKDVIMLNPQKHGFFHSLFFKSATKELVFHIKAPLLIIH